MSSTGSEKTAHVWTIVSALSTIAASIVAVFALLFGYQQFSKTHDLERESQVVELFIKYNELMKDGSPSPISGENESDFWRHNLSIGIAESIFKLRRGDEGWRETVKWMLSHHKEFLKQRGLNCDTFDDEFEKLVNEQMGQNVCRSQ
jgi:arginyl-tRNA synthetase